MNTHRLTNKEGKTIDFDSEKFPEFMTQFGKGRGCGTRSELDCTNCPIPNNGSCSIFAGSVSSSGKFLDLTLGPIEKTYNLLDLEDGVEYVLTEGSNDHFRKVGVKLERRNLRETTWYNQSNPLFYAYKTFRKIKKKKVKKTVELWCQKDLSKNIYFGLCVNEIRDVFGGCAQVKLTGEYEVEE